MITILASCMKFDSDTIFPPAEDIYWTDGPIFKCHIILENSECPLFSKRIWRLEPPSMTPLIRIGREKSLPKPWFLEIPLRGHITLRGNKILRSLSSPRSWKLDFPHKKWTNRRTDLWYLLVVDKSTTCISHCPHFWWKWFPILNSQQSRQNIRAPQG